MRMRIGRRNQDRPEDFDCAGNDGRRAERTWSVGTIRVAHCVAVNSPRRNERMFVQRPLRMPLPAGTARLKWIVELLDCLDIRAV